MKTTNPFSKLPLYTAPQALKGSVHARVEKIQKRETYGRFAGLISVSVASIGALILSSVYAWNAMTSSGFGQYVSLALTDGSVLSYWRQLGLSLVESLPALGIALVLGALGATTWSVKKLSASAFTLNHI